MLIILKLHRSIIELQAWEFWDNLAIKMPIIRSIRPRYKRNFAHACTYITFFIHVDSGPSKFWEKYGTAWRRPIDFGHRQSEKFRQGHVGKFSQSGMISISVIVVQVLIDIISDLQNQSSLDNLWLLRSIEHCKVWSYHTIYSYTRILLYH